MKGKVLKYSFMLLVCLAFVFCFMPKQSLAANNDWTYDKTAQTLTNDECVTLQNVTLSNENELTIGDNSGKDNLTNIDLTGNISDSEGNKYSITSIRDSAFRVCDSLTEITIPDSVTTIGGSAFMNCTSLTKITLPDI